MTRILLIGILFVTISTSAQSTLDIIRASNYYSKAMSNYSDKEYSTALQNLKNSESNLKGNTNKDLEYLKIMTNYKLKNYKVAYKLLVSYFEEEHSKRIIPYKNITPYRVKHEINYSENLTNIFVEIENKYKIVSDYDEDNMITSLVDKIKNEVSRNSFENLVYTKLNRSLQQSYNLSMEKNQYRSPRVYISKGKYEKINNGVFEIPYFISNVEGLKKYNWKAENQYDKVVLQFKNQSNLTRNSYSFYYAEQNRSTRFYLPSHQNNDEAYSEFKNFKLFRNKAFGLKVSEKITIRFTTEETTILEQHGMLERLKTALKKENLI